MRQLEQIAVAERRSVAVLGVPFDNVTMDEAIALMEEKICERGFHQVATANVDFLMHSIHDDALQAILCSCDLVVPDGMPIVWAARLMGSHLKERVSGVDLVPRLAALAAQRGYGMYLLGASEECSRRASAFLQTAYPDLRIVGRYCPPLASLAEMDHEEILARIERAMPDILLVAMGNPKQEKWLAMHRDRLNVPLCIGVGGSLDFLSGAVPRAPEWMRNSGLEWLHRACQEPGRLAMRYLHDAAGLAIHLPPQVAVSAIQPRKPIQSSLQAYDLGTALVAVLSGDVKTQLLVQFDQFMASAIADDRHIVLDLTEVGYLGPDLLGALARHASLVKRRDRQLWLAGIPAHARRVLRAARFGRSFDFSSSVADAVYRIEKAERLLPAELMAARSLSPEARKAVGIQVEILQDLCRRIVSLAQTVQMTLRGYGARTSAER